MHTNTLQTSRRHKRSQQSGETRHFAVQPANGSRADTLPHRKVLRLGRVCTRHLVPHAGTRGPRASAGVALAGVEDPSDPELPLRTRISAHSQGSETQNFIACPLKPRQILASGTPRASGFFVSLVSFVPLCPLWLAFAFAFAFTNHELRITNYRRTTTHYNSALASCAARAAAVPRRFDRRRAQFGCRGRQLHLVPSAAVQRRSAHQC
jgi:hypothetical protein